MLSNPDISTAVKQGIVDLVAEDSDETPVLTGAEALNDLGVNSLMLARLLIELEATVGADPFGAGDTAISDVRTVADLVAAYQGAAGTPAGAES